MFSRLDATEAKVRDMLPSRGFDASASLADRVEISKVVLAWERARTRFEVESKAKAEAKAQNLPVTLATSQHLPLRETWEDANDELDDAEAP